MAVIRDNMVELGQAQICLVNCLPGLSPVHKKISSSGDPLGGIRGLCVLR